nr:hypothetical protein [Candidatus Shikimatogenerans silvanidophilus]
MGKLLYRFKKKFNILVSAADTFRAAAISQLEILCNKYKINIFKEYESNPSSVVYNSIKYAKSKKIDIVFIDTSGRLHNNKNLLNELKKINNITKKLTYNNSFKNFLILDGTSGNIVFDQIRNFLNYIPIHFIILTKFDLTKKWGIIIGIYDQFNIPIIYISNGENIEDLYEFNKENFFNFF